MSCYHCAVESYKSVVLCARVQVVAGGLRVRCQLHLACSFHLHRTEQLDYMTSVSWRHPGALQSLRTEASAFEFGCVGECGLVSSVAVHRVTVVCVGLVWISDGDRGTNCATGVVLESTVLREISGAKVGGSDERLEKIASWGALWLILHTKYC